MKIDDLKNFLISFSKVGYGSSDEKKWVKEKDGSTTIGHVEDDWEADDNFFGGEPYGGREVVFHRGKPCWIMVYYGSAIQDVDEVYVFLKKALLMTPPEAPYRGPKEYGESNFRYKNKWNGNVERFSGKETIYRSGMEIYVGKYLGGLINK